MYGGAATSYRWTSSGGGVRESQVACRVRRSRVGILAISYKRERKLYFVS